jgi:glycosyltransferase involved in cell wall biosynthesis
MVLTRAFACSLPVVASDIPGYREVTTPETAISVVPDDPVALTEAVAALLADEPRRVEMGVAARALALDRYAWGDIARRLEGIYERVIAAQEARAA